MVNVRVIFLALFLFGIASAVPVKLSQSCGSLTCPEKTVACVKRGNNEDDPKIIKITFQCVDGDGKALSSEEKSQPNPFNGSVQIQSISINYSGNLEDIPKIKPTIKDPKPIKPIVNNKDKDIYDDVETFD